MTTATAAAGPASAAKASDNDARTAPPPITGRCHCGAIGFVFHSMLAPSQWRVRACQCSYCRAHGARTTADATGAVSLRVTEPAQLQRYRFGTHSADFLVCRRCGVYLGAVLTTARGQFATLNVNAMHSVEAAPAGTAVSYDDERIEQRAARRARQWTPLATPL